MFCWRWCVFPLHDDLIGCPLFVLEEIFLWLCYSIRCNNSLPVYRFNKLSSIWASWSLSNLVSGTQHYLSSALQQQIRLLLVVLGGFDQRNGGTGGQPYHHHPSKTGGEARRVGAEQGWGKGQWKTAVVILIRTGYRERGGRKFLYCTVKYWHTHISVSHVRDHAVVFQCTCSFFQSFSMDTVTSEALPRGSEVEQVSALV